MTKIVETLAQRLARHSEPYVEGRCRLWLGKTDRLGYGWVWWQGRSRLAHRATWECEKGPIPDGLDVLHSCDVRNCRNIHHLFLGDHQANMDDMAAKGRRALQKGEVNPAAKLTEADVRAIRKISPAEMSSAALAAAYGVHEDTVRRVRSWKIWTHLAD